MNRERIRSGKATSDLHMLVNAEPERKRPSGRILMMMSMAVAAGVAVGLIWLNQTPRGSLETLPDALVKATSVASTSTSEAMANEAVASETSIAQATEAVDIAAASVPYSADAASSYDAGGRLGAINLLVQNAPAQQAPLATTPTPTSTPMPPLASVEAVVAVGGAEVWDEATGVLVGRAPQGSLFVVTTRSEDGEWLFGTLEDSAAQEPLAGWIARDQLIVFDADRLAAQPAVIIPITPTPAGSASGVMPTAQAGGATANASILRPTPVLGDAPVAQVTLQDSRLNLRAGPGSGHPIIAKAMPGERFAILGRDASNQWLQLALPDVVGGFGWGTAEFLSAGVPLADLPITDEVSNAPVYQEGNSPAQPEQPVHPDAQGGAQRPAAKKAEQVRVGPARHQRGLSGKLAIQVSWGGDIYLYDLETAELRLLTGGFDPAISPDGTQVAFTRAGGDHGLYLINVDGTNERRIFSGREMLFSPKWSPDGQYIIFERGDEEINCTLQDPDDPASACLINREPEDNTETQEKLARVDVNGENYQDIPVLQRAHAPDWNSAGIVYHSPAGIQMTQDAPGAESKLVFFNITKQYELDPDWQPNGGRIVFQRREHDHWEIYSVAADGSGLTALTRPGYTLVEKMPSNVAPAWSPDSKNIVFLSNRLPNHSEGPWGVWVMDADGSNQRRLDIDLPFIYTFVAEQMLDWGP